MRQRDRLRSVWGVRLVAAAALLAAAAAPGRAAVFFDLGTLGGPHGAAYGLNSAGQVVGGSFPVGGPDVHAFLYSGTPGNGGAMTDLGILGGQISISYANGINASGRI